MAKIKIKTMITELKPTNLIAVEVAPDASKYELERANISVDLLYSTNLNIWQQGSVILKQGNYKILGEVTKDKIGFDVKLYVKHHFDCYRDYTATKDNFKILRTGKESFYSLLAANGFYFENQVKVSGKHIVGTINKLAQKWQSFEEKLIRGKLLILEKL